MKSTVKILIFILLSFVGCTKDVFKPPLSESIENLSLWWKWSVYNEGGRGLNLTFSGTKALNESYELKFTYTITGRDILISLNDKVDQGKCINIENGMVSSICLPSGSLFIPDSLLSSGLNKLILKTPDFETNCEFIVTNDSIVLNIPSNQHLSSLIHSVYSLPPNLLFCYTVGEGDPSKQNATYFLNDLQNSGISRITIPDYPYYDFSVDTKGDIPNSSWPPDFYSIGYIYNMHNINFKDIIAWTKNKYGTSDFKIYFYSSNGEEAPGK
jgi:hypothetical protein